MRNLIISILAVSVVVIAGCSRTSPQADSATSEPAPKPSSRLTIEPVPEADKYLRLLDIDAIVFKYSGGLIDCWLEETIGEQPARRVIDAGPELRKTLVNAKVNSDAANTGFVVITRRKLDDKEMWDVKLVVEQRDQRQLGVKLTGATAGLWNVHKGVATQDFSVIKQPQEVTGETTLITAGNSMGTVRLKCAPMKPGAE